MVYRDRENNCSLRAADVVIRDIEAAVCLIRLYTCQRGAMLSGRASDAAGSASEYLFKL
jgi:hypothetical protein